MPLQRPAYDTRHFEERRKLGAFYTPDNLSEILARWAIRSKSACVLEPSFGGCGFLKAAQSKLASLGNKDPRRNIFGCDIDSVAFEHLATTFHGPVDLERFLQTDFLKLKSPSTWPPNFDVILANPPYIPYQKISGDQRAQLRKQKFECGTIGGRASLWAYFFAHAVSFLKPGGRTAWVLPGAYLHAIYADPIRRFVVSSFDRSTTIVVRQRLFTESGTDEETVIVMCEGYKTCSNKNSHLFLAIETIAELEDAITKHHSNELHPNETSGRPASLRFNGPDKIKFDEIRKLNACRVIGNFAKVQIGIVTGANSFFVQSSAELKRNKLKTSDCRKVLSKFNAAPGLNFTSDDHVAFSMQGGRGYLIDSFGRSKNKAIRRYLRTFTRADRTKVGTFQKRKIWSQPDDRKIPDAFFPVMHHHGPRLTLNKAQYQCTNTVHRVFFKKLLLREKKLIAISLLTSFSQLSAELVGRRYGSGVLKHEPREAEKIEVLMPFVESRAITKCFARIDQLLRKGQIKNASKLADAIVYPAAGVPNWKAVSEIFDHLLQEIRSQRRPQTIHSLPIPSPHAV